MTKYICECFDGARKCTHETSGFSAPTECCVNPHATCHWRKAENPEGDTPAPKLPEWCKVGAWCYIHSGGIDTGKYQKIEAVHFGFVQTEYLVPIVNISEARLRPWNDDELKSKVGEVFEMGNGDLTLCLGYQRDRGALYFAGKGPFAYPAKTLAESDWKLDGLPCGVLEHKNEEGEWMNE